MNAKQRKALLKELEVLAKYHMVLHTYPGREDIDDADKHAELEALEAKRKVYRAEEGDGWVAWRLGRG